LDVRLLLRTDDDAPIYMSYTGLMHGSREMMRRAFTHGDVDPEQYYFRTTPYFETGDGRYAWLNRLVAVGVGRTLPNAGVSYAVHEIL
ncbi:MAG: DUF3237 domain-containing protein, partial [Alphaproteobacteria bacterium]|nr:DUF3237 domain-containing protein [Alphaproteobacteria bacterium]